MFSADSKHSEREQSVAAAPASSEQQFSISMLLFWPVGVGIALAVSKHLYQLKAHTWNHIYFWEPLPLEMDLPAHARALICGSCLAFALFALRRPNFWSSPGKICFAGLGLATLMGWTLSMFALLMMSSHHELNNATWLKPLSKLTVVSREDVLWIWFGHFEFIVGYSIFIAISIWVTWKATCEIRWKVAGLAGFAYCVFMLCESLIKDSFVSHPYLPDPSWILKYRFEFARTLVVSTMLIALLIDLAQRKPVDWWTTVACVLVIPACYAKLVLLTLGVL